MSVLALALVLLGQSGEHAELHPASADLYLEVPAVSEVLSAYDSAPLVRFLRDEAVQRVLSGLDQVGAPPPKSTVAEWLSLVRPGSAELVAEIGTASLSVSRAADPESYPGLLCVVDTNATWAAAAVHGFFESFATTTQPLESNWDTAVALHIDGLSIPLWVARSGTRVLVGGGAQSPQVTARDEGEGFAAEALLAEAASVFEEDSGATLFRYVLKGSAFELLQSLDVTMGLFGGFLASADEIFANTIDIVLSEGVVRARLADGGFRFESYRADDATDEEPRLVSEADIARIPAGSLFAFATTFDAAEFAGGMQAQLAESLLEGESMPEVASELPELFAPIGPEFLVYAFPIAGLGPPKTYAWFELEEAEGVLPRIESFFTKLGESYPGVSARAREYGVRNKTKDERFDFPMLTITVPTELLDLGPFLSTSPTLAVVGDRLLVGLRSTDVKSELKRLFAGRDAGEDGDPLAETGIDLSGRVTSLFLLDWGRQFSELLGLLQTLGPLLGELPFDPNVLPDAALFRECFPATLRVTRLVEGGRYTLHRTSFGPETWAGLGGLALSLWIRPQLVGLLEASENESD